jgi:hypothetical protein
MKPEGYTGSYALSVIDQVMEDLHRIMAENEYINTHCKAALSLLDEKPLWWWQTCDGMLAEDIAEGRFSCSMRR